MKLSKEEFNDIKRRNAWDEIEKLVVRKTVSPKGGRPSEGEEPMSGAQRQRRWREEQKKQKGV